MHRTNPDFFPPRVKPKSLFAQTSSKKLQGADIFGIRTPSPPKDGSA
jgi:hypothetical protein